MNSLTGMDRSTGAALSGEEHLLQSMGDILSTPLGSRTMLRDYGVLFDLIDRPGTPANLLVAKMAVAMAIGRWEPRIAVTRVDFEGELASGQAVATITGNRTDVVGNTLTRLTVPLNTRGASAPSR